MSSSEQRVQLEYSPELVKVPITYRLAKDLGLKINILKAAIDENGGRMILSLSGEKSEISQGLKLLEDFGVIVKAMDEYVVKNDERCIDCGGCVSICPMEAYELSPTDFKVRLDREKCVACGMCVDSCPRGAIRLNE